MLFTMVKIRVNKLRSHKLAIMENSKHNRGYTHVAVYIKHIAPIVILVYQTACGTKVLVHLVNILIKQMQLVKIGFSNPKVLGGSLHKIITVGALGQCTCKWGVSPSGGYLIIVIKDNVQVLPCKALEGVVANATW